MHALRTHIRQHVERVARLRDIERLPHQNGPVGRRLLLLRQEGEYVLDVDHADHVVELAAIDRHARMAVLRESLDQFVPACIGGHGHDFAARNRDVVGIVLAEMQQVAQHLAFYAGQVALGIVLSGRIAVLAFVFVDSLLELRAQ